MPRPTSRHCSGSSARYPRNDRLQAQSAAATTTTTAMCPIGSKSSTGGNATGVPPRACGMTPMSQVVMIATMPSAPQTRVARNPRGADLVGDEGSEARYPGRTLVSDMVFLQYALSGFAHGVGGANCSGHPRDGRCYA